MIETVWVVFATVVGWLIGNYVIDPSDPLMGAVIGFAVGLVMLTMVKLGIGEGIGDAFDILD